MDLRSYLIAIRKGWWLVLAITLLGGGAGAAFAYRAAPVYAAEVSFYISTPTTSNANSLSTAQYAQDRANSYAQILSSDRLGELIVSKAKLNLTARQVGASITGSAQLNTIIVTATVHSATPAQALAIAQAAATEFPKMVDRLDNLGSSVTNVSLSVVSGPKVGLAPIAPRKKLIIALGLLVGLVLGLMATALRHLLDSSVEDAETLEELAGAPVLATIPYDATAKSAPLVIDSKTRSLRAEAFRQLRTNLQFIDAARGLHVVVVSSAVEGEGKSTTSTNLALVMAESGRRVLLIEGDLRHPRIADFLGIERAVGLTNVLAGDVALDDVLQPWGPKALTVLVCGSLPPNPSELLGSDVMTNLLADLRQRFDFIVIDSPPLLPVTDAAVIAVEADGVVIVFRHGKTKRTQLASAVRSLHAVDARVLGAVFNMKPLRRGDKKAYGVYGNYADPLPIVGSSEIRVVESSGGQDHSQPVVGRVAEAASDAPV